MAIPAVATVAATVVFAVPPATKEGDATQQSAGRIEGRRGEGGGAVPAAWPAHGGDDRRRRETASVADRRCGQRGAAWAADKSTGGGEDWEGGRQNVVHATPTAEALKMRQAPAAWATADRGTEATRTATGSHAAAIAAAADNSAQAAAAVVDGAAIAAAAATGTATAAALAARLAHPPARCIKGKATSMTAAEPADEDDAAKSLTATGVVDAMAATTGIHAEAAVATAKAANSTAITNNQSSVMNTRRGPSAASSAAAAWPRTAPRAVWYAVVVITAGAGKLGG